MAKTVTLMVEIELLEELTQEVIEQEVTDLLSMGGGIYSPDSLAAIDFRVQLVED